MGEVSDVHGHMSESSDLRGLRRAFCSLLRGHDLLTSSPAEGCVYMCMCQGVNAKDALAWPRGAGLQGSTQEVPARGTPGSASLTNLEPDLGRSAEVSLAVA